MAEEFKPWAGKEKLSGRGNLFHDIQIIASEGIPPCPKCRSLHVMVLDHDDDSFGACLKCNHQWKVLVKSWKKSEYA